MEEEDSIERAVAARGGKFEALIISQELLNTPEGDASFAPPHSGNNTNCNHREGGGEEAAEEEKNPAMKFRNYVPQTKELQEAKVAPPVLPKFEDLVTAAPPFFNGDMYYAWKIKMSNYIQSIDYTLWDIICDGPLIPTKMNEKNEDVPKDPSECTKEEKEMLRQNAHAITLLYNSLGPMEFNQVFRCETAKEIWDTLALTYEGTSQVKDIKFNRLIQEYEAFKMKPNENLKDMMTRFNNIINALAALDKKFTNFELVSKVLRSLPREWRPKKTAIQEIHSLEKYPLSELIENLQAYEDELNRDKQEEEEEKKLRKKKGIAFKAIANLNEDSSSEEENEIVKKFNKLEQKYKKLKEKTGSTSKKDAKVICFRCGKKGHYKNECLFITKEVEKSKKKKQGK